MDAKYRRYLVFLLISIAIRIFFYFFPFESTFHQPIALTYFLYDSIFFIVLIKLLKSQKDRKWIIIFAWIAFSANILYDTLTCIGKKSSLLNVHLIDVCEISVGGILTAFYICLFWVKKGPARFFLRCLTAAIFLPFVYSALTIVLHLRSPDSQMNKPAFTTAMSILLNLLLAFAVIWASRGRQDEYADFLKD